MERIEEAGPKKILRPRGHRYVMSQRAEGRVITESHSILSAVAGYANEGIEIPVQYSQFSDVCKHDCYYCIRAKNRPEPQDFGGMQ